MIGESAPPRHPAYGARDIADAVPIAVRVLSWLGEAVDDSFITNYIRTYGESILLLVCTRSVDGTAYWSSLKSAMERPHRELFELLALEEHLSKHPGMIAPTFPEWVHLDKTLHTLRQNIALTLYDRARETAAQYPLTAVRVLQVTQRYLETVCTHDHLSRAQSLGQFYGRLGAAITLEARYGDVSGDRLRLAVGHIDYSMENMNSVPGAAEFRAEAFVHLADAVNDATALTQVVNPSTNGPQGPGGALIRAEAWLRLAEYSETSTGRTSFLAKAEGCAKSALSLPPAQSLRQRLLLGIIQHSDNLPIPIRGLQVPFGMRRHFRRWSRVEPRQTADALDRLIITYSRGECAVLHDPLGRRIVASLRSLRATLPGLRPHQRIDQFERAIALREQIRSTRGQAESQLENALDSVKLFELNDRGLLLVEGVASLIDLALSDDQWPLPVLMLAQTAEVHGAFPASARMELARKMPAESGAIGRATLSGNASYLYSLAASRALASPEVERRELGGRSGVFTAADYTGLLDDSFVFKPTELALAERDHHRSQEISRRVRERHHDRFKVADTIALIPIKPSPILTNAIDPAISARRFHNGELLASAIAADPGRAKDLLKLAARYLGFIHGSERATCSDQDSTRRELWKKDFGRWLRSGLRSNEAGALFEKWWSLVDPLLRVPRRDAHALNWIVTENGDIVAVDLEACGWRPVGYELAQLTDDVLVLGDPRETQGVRRSIARAYREALVRTGISVSLVDVTKGYQAGLASRATRMLTNVEGAETDRARGVQLLQWLASEAIEHELRVVSSEILKAWYTRRAAESSDVLSDGRRRHLSRAMAYQLRHGDESFVDTEGWAYLAAVSDALYRDGLATSKAELSLVAQAIDEVRFELRGKKVRALYGHSRPVQIRYEEAGDGVILYHGTATESLEPVLENGQGLTRRTRNWVHLSSDPEVAARTALRHGAYTLLRTVTSDSNRAFRAAGATFLMPSVAAEQLEVVSPASAMFLSAPPLEPRALTR